MIDLQGKRTVLSPGWEDVFDVHWTPAGDEVWFSASENGPDHVIFATTLSGKVRKVVSAPGGLDVEDIAADGRVLVAHGGRQPSIMARAPGATHETELTWMDFSVLSDISTDGRTILFSEQGFAGGPGYAVYVRGTDGSPAIRLGKGQAESLSPDGESALALDLTRNTLMILPTGPGASRTIAAHGIKGYSFAGWFPDGKRIFFAGFEEGKPFRMYVQGVDGGAPRAVSPDGVVALSNTLSPDGKWLVATAQNVLTAFPVGEGEPKPIKGALPADVPLRWRADGRAFFVGRRDVPMRIFAIDVTTGERTLVHEISPPNTIGANTGRYSAGVSAAIATVCLTPDGASYAYDYQQRLNSLYEVAGLK
jgi:dipeptidyl aminopeptidase/acylaminoacyl peptidase